VARADGIVASQLDGAARRADIHIFDLMKLRTAIVLASTVVETADGTDHHAIVWDGWRSVLFIGPGDFHGTQVSGSIRVDEADLSDPNHIDSSEGQTLCDYIKNIYGITRVRDAHVLMVNAKRLAGTHHV
jgi:hypothetical protein